MKKKIVVRLCIAVVTAAICLAGFFSFFGCGKKPEAKIENIMGYENAVIDNKDRTISLDVEDSVRTLSFDIIGLPGDFKLAGVYSDENCRENVTGGNFVLYSGDNVFYLKIAKKGKEDKGTVYMLKIIRPYSSEKAETDKIAGFLAGIAATFESEAFKSEDLKGEEYNRAYLDWYNKLKRPKYSPYIAGFIDILHITADKFEDFSKKYGDSFKKIANKTAAVIQRAASGEDLDAVIDEMLTAEYFDLVINTAAGILNDMASCDFKSLLPYISSLISDFCNNTKPKVTDYIKNLRTDNESGDERMREFICKIEKCPPEDKGAYFPSDEKTAEALAAFIKAAVSSLKKNKGEFAIRYRALSRDIGDIKSGKFATVNSFLAEYPLDVLLDYIKWVNETSKPYLKWIAEYAECLIGIFNEHVGNVNMPVTALDDPTEAICRFIKRLRIVPVLLDKLTAGDLVTKEEINEILKEADAAMTADYGSVPKAKLIIYLCRAADKIYNSLDDAGKDDLKNLCKEIAEIFFMMPGVSDPGALGRISDIAARFIASHKDEDVNKLKEERAREIVGEFEKAIRETEEIIGPDMESYGRLKVRPKTSASPIMIEAGTSFAGFKEYLKSRVYIEFSTYDEEGRLKLYHPGFSETEINKDGFNSTDPGWHNVTLTYTAADGKKFSDDLDYFLAKGDMTEHVRGLSCACADYDGPEDLVTLYFDFDKDGEYRLRDTYKSPVIYSYTVPKFRLSVKNNIFDMPRLSYMGIDTAKEGEGTGYVVCNDPIAGEIICPIHYVVTKTGAYDAN